MFLQGDFERAAAILRPIAERFPLLDDGPAQYYMAQMYETGRGVPTDHPRACALYLRASLDTASPDADARLDTAQRFRSSLSRGQNAECLFLERFGFHHGLERTTYALEPGFWVTLDRQEAIVAAGGQEKRFQLSVPVENSYARYLSPRRTELILGPGAERRYFIELPAWRPDQHGENWTLWWQAFEVTRTDWVLAAMVDDLLTAAGHDPPSDVDVADHVQLRAGNRGDAELLVLKGPHAGSGRIPSESERRAEQAERDAAHARDAALARVDWTVGRDQRRVPTLMYGGSDGCSDIFLFGWSADRTEAISIRADQTLLQLTAIPQTFDLSSPRPGLELTVHVYERPRRYLPFCTDVVEPYVVASELWRAVAGSVTIDVSTTVRGDERTTRATVRIDNAEFMRGDGVRVRLTAPIVLRGRVGWQTG